MQVVWREFAAMGLHFFGGWGAGHMAEVQAGLFQGFGPFAQVAGRTGGNDVFPRSDATARAGKNVIEREVALGGAILAAKLVAQKKIKAREGHALLGFHIVLQHNYRGYSKLTSLASHHLFVFGDDGDTVQESGFHRLLPRPKRQGVIGQRAIISV